MKYAYVIIISLSALLTYCQNAYGEDDVKALPGQVAAIFAQRDSLSEEELDKLVSELTSLSESGNMNANVVLATIYMERLGVLSACIDYSNSCKEEKFMTQQRNQEKKVYDLLKQASEQELGLYKFAIFLGTHSSSFYSPKDSMEFMKLAAQNADVKAIEYLIESYQFGENGFEQSTEKQEFWIRKLEEIDSR